MKRSSLQPPTVLSDENGNNFLLLTSANQQLETLWLRAECIESFYDRLHLGSSSPCSVVLMTNGVQYDVKEPAIVIASMIFQEEVDQIEMPTSSKAEN